MGSKGHAAAGAQGDQLGEPATRAAQVGKIWVLGNPSGLAAGCGDLLWMGTSMQGLTERS